MSKSLASSGSDPLRDAFRSCRKHFIYAAVFSGLLNLLFLAPTLYMLQVYDRVVPTRGVTTLLFLTFILLVSLAVLALLDSIRARLLQRASARLNEVIGGQLMMTILGRLDIGQQTRAVAMRQFDSLRQIMTGPGIVALFDAPWTPVYILVCFMLHPAIGVLALVGSALLLGLAWLNERATQRHVKEANEAENVAHFSQDFSIRSGETVRALGMRRALVARHQNERGVAVGLQGKATVTSSRFLSLTKFVRLSLQSLSLGLGAYLAINQQASAGAIFAASLLIARALAPIEQILGAWRNVITARSAYATVHDVFMKAGAERRRTHLPAPQGKVQAEDVVVYSPSREGMILQGISFVVQPGEAVAVVGASGAGKSTLLRVMSGAIPPDRGDVRFDGASIDDWDPDELAQHIGYMPQDSNLFPGTIRDNISRFSGELEPDSAVIDAKVVAAAQSTGSHDMILRLPEAYDTLLGAGGSGLSAGQTQRIALARAVYGDPAIVILDEPNAHLDAEGEMIFARCLQGLKKRGATVLLSAHRTGVLAHVDSILVLNAGRIQAFGPSDQILKRSAPPPEIASERPANVELGQRAVGA